MSRNNRNGRCSASTQSAAIDAEVAAIIGEVRSFSEKFRNQIPRLFPTNPERAGAPNSNINRNFNSRAAPSVDVESVCSDMKQQEEIDRENRYDALQKKILMVEQESKRLKEENETLKKQLQIANSNSSQRLEQTQKENLKLNRKLKSLEQERDEVLRKISKLTLTVRGLVQFTKKNGLDPDVNAVQMVKLNFPRSLQLSKIKDIIDQHWKDVEFPEVYVEPLPVNTQDDGWIEEHALISRIKNFIILNGVNHEKVHFDGKSPPKIQILFAPKPALRRSQRRSKKY